MIYRENVTGTQAAEPQTVEVNGDTVYIRSNVRRESMDVGDGRMEDMWRYNENELTHAEYDQLLALTLQIPDNEWNEGLQEACREARYMRWDGSEQSARRKIELGIEVNENQEKLNKILNYKQAVNETVNQQGYPTNVPVWPAEPKI